MSIVRTSVDRQEGGGAILIEVDAPPPPALIDEVYGPVRSARTERVISIAGDLFDDGVRLARTCAEQVVDGISALEERLRPDEFEVRLAIKLDAEVGAVLAKTSAGAQMQVTMRWRREPAGAGPDGGP